MAKTGDTRGSPVTIETGPGDWQVLQQDAQGVARVTLSGRWWTIIKRRKPQVWLRILREGCFTPLTVRHDWTLARTVVDRSVAGAEAGRHGTWRVTLPPIPRGGPYRVETCIGSAEDAREWRRGGDAVHFLCVGDVWLIAGQSNAEGYGRDPLEDPPEIGVHQFGPRGCWELAAHGMRHHPWVAFAKLLRKELGYPIGLVPTAVGGTPISRWTPGAKGDLFRAMRDRLAAAGGALRGALWYQGESDVGAQDHPKYAARFARFLAGLRRAARSPRLPVITVQLNRVLGLRKDGAGWEAMREIQRRLARELGGVFVIPVFEAGLCDAIHLGAQGNLLLAQRAAATALGGVYGRDLPFKHPECVAARRVSARKIDLRFEHVVKRLDYTWAPGQPFAFAVRDEAGEVPVVGFELPRPDVFRVLLERALAGAATVTGAAGACPPQIVPRDLDGYRGMLGFTLEVSTRKRTRSTAKGRTA